MGSYLDDPMVDDGDVGMCPGGYGKWGQLLPDIRPTEKQLKPKEGDGRNDEDSLPGTQEGLAGRWRKGQKHLR